MGRMLAAGGLSVVLFCAGAVFAADEPPPLPPPAVEGPVSEAPGELPPVVEANSAPASTTPKPAAPESRPVLVVPGVTAPGGSRPRATPRPLPSATTAAEPLSEMPALVGPNSRPVQTSPRVRSTTPQPAPRTGRSLSLETVPEEDLPEATVGPRPSTGSSIPGRASARPVPPSESQRVVSPRPAQPRPSILSRFLPAPVTGTRPYSDPRTRSAITVEPRSDPAADAALKRRIERQIGETLGTRLQSYEVRVVDRDVTIRARAARFWQRRTVRRTLETLPSLSGYHARIDMVD